jgi:hypothetical protein
MGISAARASSPGRPGRGERTVRKAQSRRLTLHRETLHQLEWSDLHHAGGGATPQCNTAICNTAAICNTISACNLRCTDYTQISTCTC